MQLGIGDLPASPNAGIAAKLRTILSVCDLACHWPGLRLEIVGAGDISCFSVDFRDVIGTVCGSNFQMMSRDRGASDDCGADPGLGFSNLNTCKYEPTGR